MSRTGQGTSVADLRQLLAWRSFDVVVRNAHVSLKQRPGDAQLWLLLGIAQMSLGRHDEAVSALNRAVRLAPDDSEANLHLMRLRQHLAAQLFTQLNDAVIAGDLDRALIPARQWVDMDPQDAAARSNLSVVLGGLGQTTLALEHAYKAVELAPDSFPFHTTLAALLDSAGHGDEAFQTRQRAYALNSEDVANRLALAEACATRGMLQQWGQYSRGGRETLPAELEAHTNLLFALTADGTVDPQASFDAHQEYGRRADEAVGGRRVVHANDRDPARRLRVGFVSADLRRHPVAGFIEPVWAALDRQAVELFVYANQALGEQDEVTVRLRGMSDQWRDVADLSDDELVRRIGEDRIDVLIDLSGHTNGHRLTAFAMRPAPVQATWIGYPNTTGLQTMDYALCDRFNAPYGRYEHLYVEKFSRIPCSGTFTPQIELPAVSELPALSSGRLTLGSFNRVCKMGTQVLDAWASVMHALPDARLLIGNVEARAAEQYLQEGFAERGVCSDRLMLRPRVGLDEYLVLHHEIDLMLDAWPYTGGTTTNYALAMGVPVVTMRGPGRAHCQAAGVLGRIGLEDWVADDVEEFIAIAVRKGRDLPALQALRSGLRGRWADAPIRQPAAVAKGLEMALRQMWGRWCQGLAPEHFEVDWGEVKQRLECT